MVPMVSVAQIIKQNSDARKLWVFGCALPWPMANRMIYLSVSAIRLEKENAYMVFVRSVQDMNWFEGTAVNRFPRTEEVTVKYGGFFIEDLG